MPPVAGIGNTPTTQQPSGGEHSNHATNAVSPNGSSGQSFSTTLAQAISQPAGGGAHGGHSNGSSELVAAPASGAPHSASHNANSSPSNDGSHPGHIPINGSNHGAKPHFQETALGLRAYRQQLIASNIANADTPGYKAVDIDFGEALSIAQSMTNTSPLMLSTTASSHIPGQIQPSAPTYPLKYHTPYQQSADGNTVEMDVERAKFSENAVMYQFSMDRVSGHFKMIMEMLQNLK